MLSGGNLGRELKRGVTNSCHSSFSVMYQCERTRGFVVQTELEVTTVFGHCAFWWREKGCEFWLCSSAETAPGLSCADVGCVV